MNIKEIIQQLRVTMDDAKGQDSHFDSWLTQNEGICKAIDALKILDAQPAPLPEQQAEPVAEKFEAMHANGNIWITTIAAAAVVRNTTPPQRQWVGLKDKDMNDPRTQNFDFIYGARWAEAKLKERNNG